MESLKLDKTILKNLLMGGTILGGGGGGSKEAGELAGKVALDYGDIELRGIEGLEDEDILITVSGVGAPAAKDKYIKPKDYVRTIELFEEITGQEIAGIITNENGGSASINGWIQSAVLGIPLIDAPANGRAHPTGTMGSMGLDKLEGFVSRQVAVGGNPKLGKHIEAYYEGEIGKVSRMVRQAAVEAGGSVAVARNPIDVAYVKENAALGGLSHAIELGQAFYQGLEISEEKAIEASVDFLKGEILAVGKVENLELTTDGGFDLGSLDVDGLNMTFWNEYMTVDREGKRLGTFPDLIMTFDKKTGYPVTTAELREGQEVLVINSKAENIKLGSTMYDKDLMREVEEVIKKDIVKYL